MGVFDFLTEYSSLVSVVAVALLTTYLTWKEKKKSNEKSMTDYQIECLSTRISELEKEQDYTRKVLDEIRYKK